MKRKIISRILTIIGVLFFAIIPLAHSESSPVDSEKWEFHAQETKVANYEKFYVRPHQSGKVGIWAQTRQ